MLDCCDVLFVSCLCFLLRFRFSIFFSCKQLEINRHVGCMYRLKFKKILLNIGLGGGHNTSIYYVKRFQRCLAISGVNCI